MTDHEAAKVLDALAGEARLWRSGKPDDRAADAQYRREAQALRHGAAALRQPRLPDRWPLAWRVSLDACGDRCWSAKMPTGNDRVVVFMAANGRWWWIMPYGKRFQGKCTTACSARRAAARAVSRAVKESLKG